MQPDYDVVIIGSGFGGSVTALRLTEKGYRVLVLEAGRRYEDDDFAKTSWNLRKFLWAPTLGCFGIQRIHLLRNVMILAGAGVGGGHNALRQVGDTPLSHDTPLAGLQVTGQQAAEHRLANAIASDQTRVTVIEYFAEPLEQRDAIGKAKRNALERDMRGIGHPCLQAMP